MAKELSLKYGCNPNQTPAKIYVQDGELPITVNNGAPGYINLLDALNGYAMVSELKTATGLPAATSFKHVSPAGSALGLPLDPLLAQIYFVEEDLSPLASAYARARGADRMSSFGDFIALSDPCDVSTARLIAGEVSDGIIAPGYSESALEILKKKRKGNYTILTIDPNYVPAETETKEVYGITFEQKRNDQLIDASLLNKIVTEQKFLTEEAKRDLVLALITLKYTQSNSVCFVKNGQTIGVGAGQQSRIHCTRLAASKADLWHLRQHPQVLALPFRSDIGRPDRDNTIDLYLSEDAQDVLGDLQWQKFFSHRPEPLSLDEKQRWLSIQTNVSMGSDAFLPFDDNVRRAFQSGVRFIAQPGGSLRDRAVIDACDLLGIAMAFTGVRLFHH
jgi:phosphoribosylaminoimidazolecarboxamide formyltransferase/IMP cyclohydrolase/phosphoribosylaminoimidazolecarboxamide formyltransferase